MDVLIDRLERADHHVIDIIADWFRAEFAQAAYRAREHARMLCRGCAKVPRDLHATGLLCTQCTLQVEEMKAMDLRYGKTHTMEYYCMYLK